MVQDNMIYNVRQKQVESSRSRLEVDATLFFDLSNLRYLTGFTGSEGVLYCSPDASVLLVDGRYTTQAKGEARACEVLEYKNKFEGIAEVLKKQQVNKVGFESSAITVDDYGQLRGLCPDITLKPLAKALSSLRSRKDKNEIEFLKHAAAIANEALLLTFADVVPGVSERHVAGRLELNMREKGSEAPSFETIVASGPHSAMPHAKVSGRLLQQGDFVVIDYGAVYEGYRSDETCTIVLGNVNSQQRRIYNIVKDAHDRAIDAVRAGVPCVEIDAVARRIIEAAGLGPYFSHGTGHGVGLDVHEAPGISPRSDGYLQEGMVITIEPGIYIPGLWGVRIEDMVLVEQDGCRLLTGTSKELTII